MKISEAKSILEVVRGASAGDIAVVSFIFLPILLASWSVLFSSMGALPTSTAGRLCFILVLIALYVVAAVVMKRTESTQSRMVRAAKHIRNRLRRRAAPNYGLASFDYIRKRVNSTYTNELLLKLVEDHPDDFMRIKCTGDRDGLKLVDDEIT